MDRARRLGERIKDLRYRRGLTQAQLAYKAGVGEKTLKRMEAGSTATPRPETVAAVAGALGITPQELFASVDQAMAAGVDETPPPAVHQLPRPPRNFTGRAQELSEIEAHLAGDDAPIVGIHGMGGVGKTCLALRVAERCSERFPDGQFYLDLRGTTEPLRSTDAMLHVIRSIDPGRAAPKSDAEVEAAYRTVLRGRRTLLFMDNAVGRDQVRPLVPPDGSVLLVTSRQRFTLAGMVSVSLAPLASEDARELLDSLSPRARAVGEQLAGLCGGLPLALSLAGRALAERPDLDPAEYASRLADDRGRLRQLDAAEQSEGVEASFDLSFGMLDDAERRNLCALSVFAQDFDRAAVGAVWDLDAERSDARIGRLLRFNLLESDGAGEGARYRLHDLVRLFADARLDPTDRERARMRHARHYLALLAQAEQSARAGSHIAALSHADREWANIRAAFETCRRRWQRDEEAARLCVSAPDANSVLRLRQHPRERIDWCRAAREVAKARADARLEARLLAHEAQAHLDLGDPRTASELGRHARELAMGVGDRATEAHILVVLGDAHHALGQPRQSIELAQRGLSLARELGSGVEEAGALVLLGWGYHVLGRPDRAIEFAEQALPVAREHANRLYEGMALMLLGFAHQARGEWERGGEYGRESLRVAHEMGDRRMEGYALLALGQPVDKADAYARALEIARETGERRMEGNALMMTGWRHSMLGAAGEAIECLEAALEISEETGDQSMKVYSLTALGVAHTLAGNLSEATARLARCVEVSAAIGNRAQEASAAWLLGCAHELAGDLHAALEAMRRAADRQQDLSLPDVHTTRERIDQVRARLGAEG
ncbi:MAG: tetratricopeptide repeat protein [Myxococcales bacterium]|jgi:transcriptional regulator with XRE-family HTH domain/tetratricopeptide (TPR) repeat protein